jgi:hypothetical protein
METGSSTTRNNSPILAASRLVLVLAVAFTMRTSELAGEESGGARLTYSKVLNGSVPEYLSITVDSSGAGTYEGRQLSDPPSSRPLKVSGITTQELFELARGSIISARVTWKATRT